MILEVCSSSSYDPGQITTGAQAHSVLDYEDEPDSEPSSSPAVLKSR